MRIGVLALALTAFLTLGIQWLGVGIGGIGESISTGRGFEKGASAGAAVALLYLVGGAFAIGRPLISAAVFALGAILGIAAGMSTDYAGLQYWGAVAGSLAGLSLLGYREKKAKERQAKISDSNG